MGGATLGADTTKNALGPRSMNESQAKVWGTPEPRPFDGATGFLPDRDSFLLHQYSCSLYLLEFSRF